MNAVETLEAAIRKLQHIAGESTPGDWNLDHDGDRFIAWHEDPDSAGFDYIVPEPIDFECAEDAVRIDVLTSTPVLDAQIALLRAVYDARHIEQKWADLVYTAVAVDLARAILGES